MHRNLIGALLVAGGLVLTSLSGAWAAENLSAATKRLFDAVWTDDMARVRASIIEGADLTAINEFGVRAVDMAVDKGHYDIAHYLLSVEKQRNDQNTASQAAPVPTPLPTNVPATQPAPAPLPVATVAPASISGVIASPASTLKPVSALAAANEPAPQPEALWKPVVEGNEPSAPNIKVLGTASPQPLSPVPKSPTPDAATQTTPKVSSVLKPSLQRDEDEGVMDKVKDFFNFSSDSKPQPEIQNTPRTETPAPKPAQSEVPEKQSQVTPPEVDKIEIAAKPVPEPPPPPQAVEPAPLKTEGERTFLGEISDFFQTGVAPDNDAKVSTAELNEQVSSEPEIQPQAISPVDNIVAKSEEEAEPATEAITESTPIAEPQPSNGPSLFDRISEIIKSEEQPQPVRPQTVPAESALPSTVAEPVANEQIASLPEAHSQEASPVENVVTETGEGPSSTVEAPSDATQITEPESSDSPSLFDQISEIFKVEETPAEDVSAAAPAEQTPTLSTPESMADVQIASQRESPSEIISTAENIVAETEDSSALQEESLSEATSITEPESSDGPSLFDQISEIFKVEETPAEDVSAEAPTVDTLKVNEPLKVESTPIVSAEPEVVEPSDSVLDSLSKWLKRDTPGEKTVVAVKEPELKVREDKPTEMVVQKPKDSDVRVVRPPVRVPKPEMVASTPTQEKAIQPTSAPTPVQATVKPSPEVAVVTPQSEPRAKPRLVKAPALGPAVSNPARINEPMIASATLKDVVFKLGDAASLGMTLATGKEHPLSCVDKSRWQTEFCIEQIIWPKAVAPSFFAESSVYRGEKAIVQYVNGRSVQLHALFPVKSLWTVTEHFKKLYGPPTEMPEVWTALIGEPKRPNRVLRWHSRDTKTGAETLLEIREIDDLRWSSPPDTKHGVVRILDKDRGSVFQLLSSTDLLLVGLRNAGR
jgi:hypothetical protein